MRTTFGSFRSSRLCVDTAQTHCSKDGKSPEHFSPVPVFPTRCSIWRYQETFGKITFSEAFMQFRPVRFRRVQRAEEMPHLSATRIHVCLRSILSSQTGPTYSIRMRCLCRQHVRSISMLVTCQFQAMPAVGASSHSRRGETAFAGHHTSIPISQ